MSGTLLIVNTIPYVAAISPIVVKLAADVPGPAQSHALWWALVLGGDFGGNLTAVGASANVVMLGIARRADNPISFWEFTRKAQSSRQCRLCCPRPSCGCDTSLSDDF